MAVIDEVEELRGRLVALNINYPDMNVRLDDTIDILDRLINTPKPGMMQYVISDLTNLKQYLLELYTLEQLRRELKPVIDLIEGLLSPVN